MATKRSLTHPELFKLFKHLDAPENVDALRGLSLEAAADRLSHALSMPVSSNTVSVLNRENKLGLGVAQARTAGTGELKIDHKLAFMAKVLRELMTQQRGEHYAGLDAIVARQTFDLGAAFDRVRTLPPPPGLPAAPVGDQHH